MIQIPQDFLEFIQLLNDREVEYLIVGGYAVAIHGYVRYTGDIDFFVALNVANAQKLVAVFREFGFEAPELDSNLFLDPGTIVRIGSEPMRLEVLNQIDGVDFAECYNNRQIISANGININFIGLRELIKNKKATQRSKDKVDAEELEKGQG